MVLVNKRFPIDKSRCRMPWECKYNNPITTCNIILRAKKNTITKIQRYFLKGHASMLTTHHKMYKSSKLNFHYAKNNCFSFCQHSH